MNLHDQIPLLGEIASLAAAIIWAGALCVFKGFGRGISASTLNLFKNSVALACLMLCLAVLQPQFPSSSSVWGMLVFSGVVGLAVGDTAQLAALARLGAQPTSALQCLSPPATIVIAFLFLGETLNLTECFGVAVTVTAVVGVVYSGRKGGSSLATLGKTALLSGVVYALISAFSYAVSIVTARAALQEVDVLMGSAIRVGPAIFVQSFAQIRRSPKRTRLYQGPGQITALTLAALGGTFLGVLLVSVGAKYAKAGLVSLLSTTYPIWIVPMAWAFLGERTSWQCLAWTLAAVLGICLIFTG